MHAAIDRLIDRLIQLIFGDDPLGLDMDSQYGNDLW